jgi:hypothetical protein
MNLIESVAEPIRAFIAGSDERCVPFVWTETAEEILAKANRKADTPSRAPVSNASS